LALQEVVHSTTRAMVGWQVVNGGEVIV